MEIKKTLPPGTVFNTSVNKNPTTIKKIYYNLEKVSEGIPIKESNLWVRVNGLFNTDRIIEEMQVLNLDYLLIEDIFNLTQRAKIEEIEDGFFAIIKVSSLNLKDVSYDQEYLSIILKHKMVFTFNDKPSGILDAIEERLKQNIGKLRNFPANFLFYSIIDLLVDANIIFEHNVNSVLSDWEESVISAKNTNIDGLHKLRKEVLIVKTNMYSLVSSIDLIDELYKNPQIIDLKKYYQDLVDHLYRLNDRLNLDWETIKSLYEMHVNNVNERTNSIMKVLTIFSAIFIPLSFLSGVFGMNFVNMEILENPNGVIIFIVLCVAIISLMIGFFKYKKWL